MPISERGSSEKTLCDMESPDRGSISTEVWKADTCVVEYKRVLFVALVQHIQPAQKEEFFYLPGHRSLSQLAS